MKPPTYAVVYHYPLCGEPAIHYRRPRTDTRLAREVLALQRKARAGGYVSPYSISTKPIHTL